MTRSEQVLRTRIRTGQHPELCKLLRCIRPDMPISCRGCSAIDHLRTKEAPHPPPAVYCCPRCRYTSKKKATVNKPCLSYHKGCDPVGKSFKCEVTRPQRCDHLTLSKRKMAEHYSTCHPRAVPPRWLAREMVVRRPSTGEAETLAHLLVCQKVRELGLDSSRLDLFDFYSNLLLLPPFATRKGVG